ncbi:MAG TPA: hypothetical protein VI564_08245 [Candidatus Nanoarchaeia archaeon]|nr:hypothetical protein [Candidatus Nanoarchaeia archaeon]
MEKKKFRIDEIGLVLIVVALIMVVSVYDKSGLGGGKNLASLTDPEYRAAQIRQNLYINFAEKPGNTLVFEESSIEKMQQMQSGTLKKSLELGDNFCIRIEGPDSVILNRESGKFSQDFSPCEQ